MYTMPCHAMSTDNKDFMERREGGSLVRPFGYCTMYYGPALSHRRSGRVVGTWGERIGEGLRCLASWYDSETRLAVKKRVG